MFPARVTPIKGEEKNLNPSLYFLVFFLEGLHNKDNDILEGKRLHKILLMLHVDDNSCRRAIARTAPPFEILFLANDASC